MAGAIASTNSAGLVLNDSVGTGALTLSGNNLYTGGTTVTAGTLVAGGSGLALGTVNVASGATLAVAQTGNVGLAGQFFQVVQTGGSGEVYPSQAAYNSLASLQANIGAASPTNTATGSLTPQGVTTSPVINFLANSEGVPGSQLFPTALNASGGYNNFQAYFSGMVNIPAGQGGTYTFQAGSDDGSMVWVNGQLVVSNNAFQGVNYRNGTITLSPGENSIVVGYYQGNGGYGLEAQMSGPSTGNAMVDMGSSSAPVTPDLVVGSLSGSGAVQLTTGGLVTGTDGTSTAYGGVMSGVGGLTKFGAGTFALTGANTFTGLVSIGAGTLQIGNGGASGSIASTPTINDGGTLAFDRTGTNTFANTITGAGAVVQMGAGMTVINGANTYTGGTTIQSGGAITSGGASLSTGTVNVLAGGTLNVGLPGVNGFTSAYYYPGGLSNTGGTTGNANANFDSLAALETHLASLTPAATLTTPVLDLPGTYTSIGKGNPGVVPGAFPANILTNPNNFESIYTGTITVPVGQGGSYTFSTTSDDGSMLWINGQQIVNNNYYQGYVTRSGTITLAPGSYEIETAFYQGGGDYGFQAQMNGPSTGGLTVDIGSSYAAATPDMTIGSLQGAGAVVLSTTLVTGLDNTNTTYSGTMSGAGGLNKEGTGTFTMGGTSTYSGNTNIVAGTLAMGANNALPSGAGVAGLVNVVGGTFDLMGTSQQINGMQGAGMVQSSGAPGTLSVGSGNAVASYGGVLSDGTATGSQLALTVVAGSGLQTLTGANTYTGATTIGGNLALATAASLGGTPVSVNTGGTLQITGAATSGSATIGTGAAGSVTLNGGTIAFVDQPAIATTLNINNSTVGAAAFTTGSAGGALSINAVNSTGSTSAFAVDAINVTGAAAFNGVTTVNIAGLTLNTGTYPIITYTSETTGAGGAFNFANGQTGEIVGSELYSLQTTGTAENLVVTNASASPTAAYWTSLAGNYWNGYNGTNTSWATAQPGTPDANAAPGGTTDVYMTANNATALNTVLGANFSINSLTFSGSGTPNSAPTTIGGSNTLTIMGAAGAYSAGTGIVVNSGSGADTISANVALGGAQSWTNNSASLLTVSGAVNTGVATGYALTVAGSGPVTLGGVVSGLGSVTYSSTAPMIVASNNSYGGGSTISTGSAVQVGAGNGAGTLGNGAIVNNGSLTFVPGTGNALNVNAPISGTGSITLSSPGTLNITLPSNTSTGGMTINQGTVNAVGAPTSGNLVLGSGLGTGAVTLGGGALNLVGGYQEGLTANFYQETSTTLTNNTSYLNTYSTMESHFAGLTPTVTVNTTDNGKANFDFSNGNYGNAAPFGGTAATQGNFGFTGTSYFEAYMTGEVVVTTTGTYTFATTSDDGSVLYVNGKEVVANNAYQGATTHTGTIALSPGVYPIEIAYYQGGGGMGFLVQSNLSSPGSTTLSTLLNSQVTTGVLSASQFFNTPINVAADATVNVSGSLAATVGSLAIGAQTLTVASSDTSGSAYSLTAGAVTLSGNATFNVANSTGGGAGTLTLGPITGTSNVTVLGPGVVSLPYDSSGALSGGYTGTTIIGSGLAAGGGAVVAGNTGSLGTGQVTLAGGSLELNATNNITGFGGNGTGWTVNTSGPYTTAATPITNNVLTVTDGANNEGRTAFLNAPQAVAGPSGFTASFVYQAVAAGSGNEADGATFMLQNNGANSLTQLGATGGALAYGPGTGAIANSAAIDFNIYSGHTIGTNFITGGTGTGTYNATGSVNVANGDPIQVGITYNTAAQTLTETLTDTKTLATYSTTYTGVNLSADLGSNTSAYVGFSGGSGGQGATQTFSDFVMTSGSTAGAANLRQQCGGHGQFGDQCEHFGRRLDGRLTIGSSTLDVTGSIASAAPYSLTFGATTLSGNPVFDVANNGAGAGTLILGSLSDGGTASTITLQDNGQLTLNSDATSLVQGTVIDINGSATLNSNHAAAIGTLATVNLAAGTTFNVGASQTVSALNSTASGSTVNVGSGYTLTIGGADNLNSSYLGSIAGAGGVAIGGTGAVYLGGANTYTGGTSLNAGTLFVNGSQGTAGTPTDGGFTAAASSILAGSGSIYLASGSPGILVSAGAIFTPGYDPNNAGAKSIQGLLVAAAASSGAAVTLAPTATLDAYLTSSTAGFGFVAGGSTTMLPNDYLNVTSGVVNLDGASGTGAGATLSLFANSSVVAGQSFLLIDPSATNGTFGSVTTSGLNPGLSVNVLYGQGPNGQDVVLTVVPEPASWALVAIASLMLCGFAWRRGLAARRREAPARCFNKCRCS